MRYCLNPACDQPQNPDTEQLCRWCGSPLRSRDRYIAVQRLGKGEFGRTFLAVDLSDRFCVIKQVSSTDPQFALDAPAQFQRKVERLNELGSYSQIPALLDAFEQKGWFYFIYEWIKGESLAAELQDQGTFCESQIWQILNDLLPIIQLVHDHQMIHGDIKPENIIRRSDGHVVLVDFTTAIILPELVLTTSRQGGSAEYVAPEQVRGDAVLASDLYSLGVTCLHLLTQLSPFDLFDVTLNAWVWWQFLPEAVSDRLTAILDRLVAPSLSQRFQSAQQALHELQANTADSSACLPTYPVISTIDRPVQVPSAQLLTIEYAHLAGHSGSINAIALHPEGTVLASAGDDKIIRLWDLTTHQLLAVLTGSQASVRSLDFSPDGEQLVSAGDDQLIRLWNWRTQDTVAIFRGHTAAVRSVQFSAASFLVSGSWDKTIKVWRLDTGDLAATWSGHKLQVNAVACSPDGRTIASASCDRTVRLWSFSDTAAVQPGPILADHTWSVTTVAFSPNGQLLATGSDDNTIKLWDVATGTVLHSLAHSWTVAAVAFSPDGKLLISGSWDKTVKLWTLNGEEVAILSEATDAIHAIAVTTASATPAQPGDKNLPARYLVSAGGCDRLIHRWYLSRTE